MPTLRFFAAARAAAGVDEERRRGRTLAEVLQAACAARDERFASVLSLCSFLIDGEPTGVRPHDALVLHETAVVDCLPPFAGG